MQFMAFAMVVGEVEERVVAAAAAEVVENMEEED